LNEFGIIIWNREGIHTTPKNRAYTLQHFTINLQLQIKTEPINTKTKKFKRKKGKEKETRFFFFKGGHFLEKKRDNYDNIKKNT